MGIVAAEGVTQTAVKKSRGFGIRKSFVVRPFQRKDRDCGR